MNVLALCAGVGGLDLGVKLANPTARCVCYVEGEAYAAAVLVKRMEEKALDEAPIWSDVRTFDGKPWRGKVDCITGGYPCQPFSVIGKKLGDKDPRHLFPSIRRIIEEVQPEWCFFENVAAHLTMGFEQVHDDLCQMGYRVAAGIFAASEVGGCHQRERLFILSHAPCFGGKKFSISNDKKRSLVSPGTGTDRRIGLRHSATGVSFDRGVDATSEDDLGEGSHPAFPPTADDERWRKITFMPLKRTISGVDDGSSYRMDRYRACGNAVVPLVGAYAWRVLEDSLKI